MTIRRFNEFLLSSIFLLAAGYPGLRPCFAGMYARVPRVLNSCVTITSTVFKPGTAVTTTTHFPRFRDGAAFGACWRTDGGRRSFWWDLMCALVKDRKKGNAATVTDPWCNTTCHKPRTYVCRPLCPQPTCDLRFCLQHLRRSCTKHHQERNN